MFNSMLQQLVLRYAFIKQMAPTLAAWLKTIIKMLFTGILKLSVKCIFIKNVKTKLFARKYHLLFFRLGPLYMSNNLSRSIAKELQPHK